MIYYIILYYITHKSDVFRVMCPL